MDQAILQALYSLLPQQNAEIPQELVGLANALLAQSRNQASTLKSDEEIARLYACAHLACSRLAFNLNSSRKLSLASRLRRPLGLPKMVVRPPCLPRTYQSLYRHFDGILQAGTKRRSKPSTLNNNPSARVTTISTSSHKPIALSTTDNDSCLDSDTLPLSVEEPNLNDNIPRLPLDTPDWAKGIIYRVSRATSATIAPPHVFAGLGIALRTFSQTPLMPIEHRFLAEQARLVPLILAIHLCVSLRLSGEHISGEAFDDEAKKVVQATGELQLNDEGWQDAQLKMIHAWIAYFREQHFLEKEWYHNIPKGDVSSNQLDQAIIENDLKLNIHSLRHTSNQQSGRYTLIPGLGTMVCLFHL